MNNPEVWLRGPITNISPYLQPAAHALLQVSEDLPALFQDFPETLLHDKVLGKASVAFHLKHLTGVLDRMMSYAQEKSLSEKQFQFLKNEKEQFAEDHAQLLISQFQEKVQEALRYFTSLKDADLTSFRAVGRQKLPSSLLGLLFHAAEHAQRHYGQLLLTVTFLKAQKP